MNTKHKNILLSVAKQAVYLTVTKKGKVPVPTSEDPVLNEHCGCFVTLKNGPDLRGCIGQFTSEKPLIELVSEMAVAASSQDPRFFLNPITQYEFEFLDIEISVLSPLKETKDPLSLRLGIDGIYITKGRKSGCFLPQVATETGWTEKQFLDNCCVHKAHLPAGAWKEPGTQVYLFTADAFSAAFNNISI